MDQSLLKRRSGGGLSHSGKGGWVGGVSQFCSTDKEEPGGGGVRGKRFTALHFSAIGKWSRTSKAPFSLSSSVLKSVYFEFFSHRFCILVHI